MKIESAKRRESRNLYLSFLQGEIPNVVQIIGIPSILGSILLAISNSPYRILLSSLLSLIVGYLLMAYLLEMAERFLSKQLTDPYSNLNRKKLDFDKLLEEWTSNLKISSVLLIVFVNVLIAVLCRLR